MRLANYRDVGTITSAGTVAATIFCCLPFATDLFGASVAAFGTRIASLQPYLIFISTVMLGALPGAFPDLAMLGAFALILSAVLLDEKLRLKLLIDAEDAATIRANWRGLPNSSRRRSSYAW